MHAVATAATSPAATHAVATSPAVAPAVGPAAIPHPAASTTKSILAQDAKPDVPTAKSSAPAVQPDAPLGTKLESIASKPNLSDAITALSLWSKVQSSTSPLTAFFDCQALECIMTSLFTTQQDPDITVFVTNFLQQLLDLSDEQSFALLTSLQFVLKTSNQWEHVHGRVQHNGIAAVVSRVCAAIRSLYSSIIRQRTVQQSRQNLTSLVENADSLSNSIAALPSDLSSIRTLLEKREMTSERLSLQLQVCNFLHYILLNYCS